MAPASGLDRKIGDPGTRAEILKHAAALFVERGYARTSVKAIAERVGIAAPSIYWFYENKQAILVEFLRNCLEDFLQTMQVQVHGNTPAERLTSYITAHVRAQLTDRTRAASYDALRTTGYRDNLSPAQRAELAELQNRIVDIPRGIIAAGRDSGDFQVTDVTVATYALVTMADTVYQWYDPGGSLTADEIAHQYAELALRSLTVGQLSSVLRD
ncbi:TetR/AcrR family transcriptional regulator [Nonomuraea sp. 3N208]|uniref:TetR/AcrR family transcriptional regulator n=1 Tax=Nonomuraea sp. 3N208 TaxID=3457421 RepID=UPI003FD55695